MNARAKDKFQMSCFNATDNQLINIALDELQKVGQDEDNDFHSQCAQMASDEMERRGLDPISIQGAYDDLDFEQAA